VIKLPYSLYKVGDLITPGYRKSSEYYYVLGAPCSREGSYILLNPNGAENHELGIFVEVMCDLVSSVFREADD
jgi:hypothetical protein